MKFLNLFAASKRKPNPAHRRPTTTRLAVERLDERVVMATLSIADLTVVEGTSGVQTAAVTVTLSEASKKPVSVNYHTVGSTAGSSDFAAAAGSLSFAKGQTVKTILIPVYGDTLPEYYETFWVRLTNAKGATIADSLGIVTIADPSPKVILSGLPGDEGDALTFTVSLSAPLATTFSVDFATSDAGAVAGEDYVATSGTLTFAPGETIKTFTVQTLVDTEMEWDEEFFVSLTNPSAPAVIQSYGWGYIYGDWGAPPE